MNTPPFKKFPVLSSDRIVLRAVEVADISDIVDISFYDTKQAENVEQALNMLELIVQDYQNGNSIHWGISDRTNNKIMGTCGYYRGFENGTGELGCVLLPAFQGQGIMTNAINSAIDFGLNTMQLNRIMAITTTENSRAIKLLERLKFIKTEDLQDGEIKFELKAKVYK